MDWTMGLGKKGKMEKAKGWIVAITRKRGRLVLITISDLAFDAGSGPTETEFPSPGWLWLQMRMKPAGSRSTAIGAYMHTARRTAKHQVQTVSISRVGRELCICVFLGHAGQWETWPPPSQPVLNTGPQYRFSTAHGLAGERFKLALSLLHLDLSISLCKHQVARCIARLLAPRLTLRFLPR